MSLNVLKFHILLILGISNIIDRRRKCTMANEISLKCLKDEKNKKIPFIEIEFFKSLNPKHGDFMTVTHLRAPDTDTSTEWVRIIGETADTGVVEFGAVIDHENNNLLLSVGEKFEESSDDPNKYNDTDKLRGEKEKRVMIKKQRAEHILMIYESLVSAWNSRNVI